MTTSKELQPAHQPDQNCISLEVPEPPTIPKDLKDEYERIQKSLSEWLESLYVDCYLHTLLNTERVGGWHLYLSVAEEHFETVMLKIHEMPKTSLKLRVDSGGPVNF